jgi:hypothetical protein
MPLRKNTILLDRLTHTTLADNSKPAPIARLVFPCPNIIPTAAAGGSNATATITPTSIFDRPVVSESAAAPDARAKIMESIPTFVRAVSSKLEISYGKMCLL